MYEGENMLEYMLIQDMGASDRSCVQIRNTHTYAHIYTYAYIYASSPRFADLDPFLLFVR